MKSIGKEKKPRATNLPGMTSTPTLPPVQSCSAKEERAIGGSENQGNGLKPQYRLEGKKNKSQS